MPITGFYPAGRNQGNTAAGAVSLVNDTTPTATFMTICPPIKTAPVNGTSGTYANMAAPGSLLVGNITLGSKLYINTNTQASPTWTVVGTQT